VNGHDNERFGMPEGQVLEFSAVTKRFGGITAVSDFTARVEPGRVTGFLGPNGAGKTTTMRILLGLVKATSGTATIGGTPYRRLRHPLQSVGAVLEASSFHPGRTAANHLTVYAQAAGIARTRVDEVLDLVGLSDAAGRRIGGFSLGMRQRLGLAYALLGDPGVLVLDEPSNGLDPEGIRWMRGFLRGLAREGRTVFVSSHLLTEIQQTVDDLLIISRGRLVFQGGLDELADPTETATVVDAPDRGALVAALRAAEVPFEVLRSGLTVRYSSPADVGEVAAGAGVALSSLQRRGPALEEVFLDLVNGVRVHPSAGGMARPTGPAALGPSTGAAAPATPAEDERESGGVPQAEPDAASAEPRADPETPGDTGTADDTGTPDDTGAMSEQDAPEVAPAATAEPVSTSDEPEAEHEPGSDAFGTDPAPADEAPSAPIDEAPSETTDQAESEATDHEPSEPAPTTASFVVAATGVIDIVPPSADDHGDSPGDRSEQPVSDSDHHPDHEESHAR
jgi:ABC-2 type transport system ATP-binding protein